MNFLVIGNHYYGKGSDLAEAKKNFRKVGGTLSYGYNILQFTAEHTDIRVNDFGQVSWKGTTKQPVITEVKPRKKAS